MEVCVKNRMARRAAWTATGVIVTLAISTLTGMPLDLFPEYLPRPPGLYP